MTFADLAQNSTGVKRIGVLRADVDNLGLAFVEGFCVKILQKTNIVMSLYLGLLLFPKLVNIFKYYLNHLLEKVIIV